MHARGHLLRASTPRSNQKTAGVLSHQLRHRHGRPTAGGL